MALITLKEPLWDIANCSKIHIAAFTVTANIKVSDGCSQVITQQSLPSTSRILCSSRFDTLSSPDNGSSSLSHQSQKLPLYCSSLKPHLSRKFIHRKLLWYGRLNQNGPPRLTPWNTNLEVLGRIRRLQPLLEGVCHRGGGFEVSKTHTVPSISFSLSYACVSRCPRLLPCSSSYGDELFSLGNCKTPINPFSSQLPWPWHLIPVIGKQLGHTVFALVWLTSLGMIHVLSSFRSTCFHRLSNIPSCSQSTFWSCGDGSLRCFLVNKIPANRDIHLP